MDREAGLKHWRLGVERASYAAGLAARATASGAILSPAASGVPSGTVGARLDFGFVLLGPQRILVF
jgi:hypothetical protein